MRLSASAIERVFAELFAPRHRTLLVGGGDEPLYEPPTADVPGRIVYRADYASSALHEVAHWCVAGAYRRTLLDFGYWYTPDGRTPEQQAAFEKVEVAPQALESLFADAAGVRFVPSADNVEAGLGPSDTFLAALAERRTELLDGALKGRARAFRDALAEARIQRL